MPPPQRRGLVVLRLEAGLRVTFHVGPGLKQSGAPTPTAGVEGFARPPTEFSHQRPGLALTTPCATWDESALGRTSGATGLVRTSLFAATRNVPR